MTKDDMDRTMPAPADAAPVSLRCSVCRDARTVLFLADATKRYHRCRRCLATFLDPAQRPDPATERAHYATHENDPADPRYRAFLNRLAAPLLERLPSAGRGLDYGCGPGPALAQMLREVGHHMALYDPFFAPDPAPLAERYDFVTCTEVAEHFHDPYAEFRRLDALLRPGGYLAVMTMFQTDDARFAAWHYRLDPTHVVFYRRATLRTLADDIGWECGFPVRNVVIFRKGTH